MRKENYQLKLEEFPILIWRSMRGQLNLMAKESVISSKVDSLNQSLSFCFAINTLIFMEWTGSVNQNEIYIQMKLKIYTLLSFYFGLLVYNPQKFPSKSVEFGLGDHFIPVYWISNPLSDIMSTSVQFVNFVIRHKEHFCSWKVKRITKGKCWPAQFYQHKILVLHFLIWMTGHKI